MTVRVLVGTSGYAYKEWKGTFYPADLKVDAMLGYYGERLDTVEINNTFYRMPKENVVAQWAAQVPDGFRFVLKASQRITHHHRLKDAGELLDFFLRSSSALGAKRGPTLFQLPPNMRKDVPRLRDFLALLPKRWPAAFEFRHESWFDDETYDALREGGAVLCAADTEDGAPDLVATAEWGYLRLRREDYTEGQLDEWARRIMSQPWQEAFVFFKHEEAGAGPKLAERFAALCRD